MRTTPLSRHLSGPRPRRGSARLALVGTAAAVALALVPGVSATAATVADPEGGATTDESSATSEGAPAVDDADNGATEAASADLIVVRLRVAGRAAERVSTTRGIRPRPLLRAHGVRADRNDLVVVKRDGRKVRGQKRRLRAGDLVKVVDVRRSTKVKRVRVEQRTVTRATTELRPGRRKVVASGRPAVHAVKVRRVHHDERLVKRKVVSRKVVRPAKPRRVLVGRKSTSVAGADRLNWPALARCESGGNPRAVNPSGYYGLYQFNVATWRSVGGSGMPHHATAAQQTFRAKLLYKSRGRQPWPHCGRYL